MRATPRMWDLSISFAVDCSVSHGVPGVQAYTMSYVLGGDALVSAGKDGMVSLAWCKHSAACADEAAAARFGDEIMLTEQVVMWAGHTRWVSDAVQPDGAPLLLTASDDASIAVWELEKPGGIGTRGPGHVPSASGLGPPLLHRSHLHSGGVYSVDAGTSGSGVTVVSGSKDTSVMHCCVDASGILRPLHTFADAHAGVVKSVRLRKDGRGMTAASAGNDRAVAVWDLRSDRQAVTIPAAHSLSINTVSWSPDGGCVLTGGFDNAVKLWDVRKPATCLWQASAAASVSAGRADSIIHPAYALQGRVVLVPIPKLYSVLTLDAVTGVPLGVGEDCSGLLELLVEDQPLLPAQMAVREHSGYSCGGLLSSLPSGGPMEVAIGNNRRTQVWELRATRQCG